MDDFRTMFPSLDVELIESVLRANGGAVDDTIDQLLTIPVDGSESTTNGSSTSVSALSCAFKITFFPNFLTASDSMSWDFHILVLSFN